jgi:hypothetical protein
MSRAREGKRTLTIAYFSDFSSPPPGKLFRAKKIIRKIIVTGW